MELTVSIKDRQLNYSSSKFSGESLDGLVQKADLSKIEKVLIDGESKSYTLLRQVALLVNILIKINSAKIELKSKSFKKTKGLLFPIYR